jgi:uroporphyrinogen decarboxylase
MFLGGARHVLERAKTTMGKAYRNPGGIARVQQVAAEMFGHDAGTVPWGCLTVEAEAFGCELEWHDDYYPRVASHPLEEERDLRRLIAPDPSASGRMPLVLEALASVRERMGEDQFLIAMVVSPFLVAAELRGMVPLLADFVLEADFVDDLMATVGDGVERYVRAIAAQGAADAIMFENAGACAQMMGPGHVDRFVMPYERRLLASAREVAPSMSLIEHNCAEAPYVDRVLALDVDAVSVAHTDPETVQNAGMARFGAVDNQRLMLEGTPEAVGDAAQAELAAAGKTAYVLATSCEIPFAAPIRNIEALSRACAEADPS